MVDFGKRLTSKKIEKKTNPIEIYEGLDRESDKGPLRPVQIKILNKWMKDYSEKKDIILKLHTGQGKTITGLLMLQSKLNQDKGPALYLCHNNQLVEQTCKQASSFGIRYCTVGTEVPDEFIDGKKILITSVQKLFNGETKFGIGSRSISCSTILMDDAHACIEAIKSAFRINLKQGSNAYAELFELFTPSLQSQGVGTFADIKRKNYDALLAVPYWDWQDKHTEVAEILSKYSAVKEIRFPWPLIKDIIRDCQCYISGASLEIIPYVNPLHLFGTYSKAEHRIFMSATITDDSFFIKGLGVSSEAVNKPLALEDEGWSGEKMILIPTLIDSNLERSEIVNMFAKPDKARKYGIVALSPSFNSTKDWESYGATIANKATLEVEIQNLKDKNYSNTLVIVNRYDGIDLPDNVCRVLVFDSRPHFESLYDRYIEECRPASEEVSTRLAQTIEQGFGRGVRGERDFCLIVVTGTELVRAIRSKNSRKYFSEQTRTQIEIGLRVAEFAKEDLGEDSQPSEAINALVHQLIDRDETWKEFYKEEMGEMGNPGNSNKMLEVFKIEKQADAKYLQRDYQGAAQEIQNLIDKHVKDDSEKGWYFQEMARYLHPHSKIESEKYQIMAHKKNTFLLKPKEGVKVTKIPPLSLKRIENIKAWVHRFDNYDDLYVELSDTLDKLSIGVNSDKFEQAFDELAKMLGFLSQRPDKEWKEGPDNLWKLSDSKYLMAECKNSVIAGRTEIYKDETGQMNNACAWFSKNYGEVTVKRIMIIPTKNIAKAAGFNESVQIMQEKHLGALRRNVKQFFYEFKSLDLSSLSDQRLQDMLVQYKLQVDDIVSSIYSDEPRQK
ncbi:hypothetical protein C161_26920 [Paenibacillus sp. FSL R5-192]|uniref:DEAD/DEAH box helicase family protein n=1 Tax=Paenibacillus sp. FSL R5-192 TaxID=1226754 RepID=UPI0003E1ECDC|nr:DEAD/DEAH box helicase family protein [Paenibacillus sp. FSL R5-192]ETT31667.1 hypothetical protein C161_26920 [Paenibacillus sp. FSL R5-192]